MKTIYLIRHAKSSWDDPSLDDADRPLNKRGEKDAPMMAKLLAGKGVHPDRLISSPARRALKTATFFARAFGFDKKEIQVDPVIYEAYPGDLLGLIQKLPNDWSTVCLFGHNPTLTTFANRFADRLIANIPTCGIVRLDAEVGSWADFNEQTARVGDFIFPKQFS